MVISPSLLIIEREGRVLMGTQQSNINSKPKIISKGVLQKDIFYNEHLIPKDATYKVVEIQKK